MITDNDLYLVNVSDLNQYLYCPRRLYYLMFYQTQGLNYYLADGAQNIRTRAGEAVGIAKYTLSLKKCTCMARSTL